MNHDFDTSIINIADDFYEAHLRCLEGKNPNVDEFNRTRYEVANVPAIVNGAFAMELYIKSVSRAGKRKLKKKKHNIKDLLSTLDQSLQDEFRKEVESKLEKPYEYNKCLDGINDAFVFWRYIHTRKNFGFGLNNTLNVLPIFLEAIRNIAKRPRQ